MNTISTDGLSIIPIRNLKVSILSKRACKLVLKKSTFGGWKYPVTSFRIAIDCCPYIIVAFQPATNRCIGFKITKTQDKISYGYGNISF